MALSSSIMLHLRDDNEEIKNLRNQAETLGKAQVDNTWQQIKQFLLLLIWKIYHSVSGASCSDDRHIKISMLCGAFVVFEFSIQWGHRGEKRWMEACTKWNHTKKPGTQSKLPEFLSNKLIKPVLHKKRKIVLEKLISKAGVSIKI